MSLGGLGDQARKEGGREAMKLLREASLVAESLLLSDFGIPY